VKLTTHFYLEPTLRMRDAILVALCVFDLPIIKCSEKNNDSETPPSVLGKGKGKGKGVWGN